MIRRIASNYILRRLGKSFVTVWVVVTATFFIIRLMPGNPVDIYIQEQMALYGMTYDDARAQASAMFAIQLDRPVIFQYFDYIGNLVRFEAAVGGDTPASLQRKYLFELRLPPDPEQTWFACGFTDMGLSYRSFGTPVVSIVAQYLPWTLFSVGLSLLISFTLGMVLGTATAYWRESLLDHGLSTVGSILSSVPNYLVAMVLMVFLGVQWSILPLAQIRGSHSPGIEPGFTPQFLGDILYHAIMPVSIYVLTTIGGWMLTMKSSTIATLEEDYVNVARARGLPDRRIMTAYVGRNAMLPLVTQLAISVGFIVGGSVLIESICVYQGISGQLLASINQRDYPVMQAVFLIITISVILANFLADMLYSWLDPRIRTTGGKS